MAAKKASAAGAAASAVSSITGDVSRIHLSVLQRFDSDIISLIHHTKHVVIYHMVNNQWAKKGIEGSLFIVTRSRAPLYRIIVQNRKSDENLQHDIHPSATYERHQQTYIFYRSNSGTEGIWFYDTKDCESTFELIQKLSSEVGTKEGWRAPSPSRRSSAGRSRPSITQVEGVPSSSASSASSSPSTSYVAGASLLHLLQASSSGTSTATGNSASITAASVPLSSLSHANVSRVAPSSAITAADLERQLSGSSRSSSSKANDMTATPNNGINNDNNNNNGIIDDNDNNNDGRSIIDSLSHTLSSMHLNGGPSFPPIGFASNWATAPPPPSSMVSSEGTPRLLSPSHFGTSSNSSGHSNNNNISAAPARSGRDKFRQHLLTLVQDDRFIDALYGRYCHEVDVANRYNGSSNGNGAPMMHASSHIPPPVSSSSLGVASLPLPLPFGGAPMMHAAYPPMAYAPHSGHAHAHDHDHTSYGGPIAGAPPLSYSSGIAYHNGAPAPLHHHGSASSPQSHMHHASHGHAHHHNNAPNGAPVSVPPFSYHHGVPSSHGGMHTHR